MTLIAEGARGARLEFPWHLPDLQHPKKALIWGKIWPEAFSRMNDCLNVSVRLDKPDMLCPWVKLCRQAPEFAGFAVRDAGRWTASRRSGRSWRKAERSNERPTLFRPRRCMRGKLTSLVRLWVIKFGWQLVVFPA